MKKSWMLLRLKSPNGLMTNILYNDGLIPEQSSIGDINCDSSIDVSDIVYLIDFVFNDSMNTGSRLDCKVK